MFLHFTGNKTLEKQKSRGKGEKTAQKKRVNVTGYKANS